VTNDRRSAVGMVWLMFHLGGRGFYLGPN